MEIILILLAASAVMVIFAFSSLCSFRSLYKILIYTPAILSLIMIGRWNMFRIFGIPVAYLAYYFVVIIAMIQVVLREKRLLLPSVGRVWLCFFLVYLFLSVLWVRHVLSWAQYLLSWAINIVLVYFGVYNLVVNAVKTKEDVVSIVSDYKTAITIMGLIGLLKYFLLGYSVSNPIDLLERNSIPMVMIPYLSVALSSFLIPAENMRRNSKSTCNYIMLGLPILCILFLFSRTGYMGLVIAVCLNYIAISKHKDLPGKIRVYFRQIIIPAIVVILVGLLITSYTPRYVRPYIERVTARITSMTNAISSLLSGAVDSEDSDFRRQLLLLANREIIKARPLFGTGLGLANYIDHFPVSLMMLSNKPPAKPHSLYFSLLGELGIIGFLFVTIFFIRFVMWNYKRLSVICDVYLRHVSFSLLAGVVAMLAMFYGNEFIHFPAVWMHLAVTTALCKSAHQLGNVATQKT